jgi:hypothetical protein
MEMQDSTASIEISAGVSKPTRRRRRTRHKLSPVAAGIVFSFEDPNDGDKDEDSDEAEDVQYPPPIPIVVLTAPLATVLEVPKSPTSDVQAPPASLARAVGFPDAKARKIGLQAKTRAVGGLVCERELAAFLDSY